MYNSHHFKSASTATTAIEPVIPVTIDDLIDRYDTLLFDAYGVLVHKSGALPGACELLDRLRRLNKPFFIVTNSAARLPENAALRYQRFGLYVSPEQIITSGSLLKPYFAANQMQGCKCAILGPEDTYRYVEQAGGIALPPDADFDALVIGDQVGFPFLESVDMVLSRLITKFDQGSNPRMILPNPDLIYPKERGFGITSGAVALVIESALRQRYPGHPQTGFIPLGKPEPAIFAEAARRSNTRNMVMIGDQLATDIKGATTFGVDSALVTGGVAELAFLDSSQTCLPTYLLRSL